VDQETMTPDEYKFLYELEERHWWFVGMRRIVAALLDGAVPGRAERILDAGCGTGLMLSWLRRYGKESSVFGLDFSSFAVRYSAQRGERLLVEGSIAAMPFPSECFDLVTTFDVLDSFPVPGAAAPFGELARVLKPGGVLLVRVPAFQFLYSQHDRAVCTEHRYTARELRQRLEEQGLTIARTTYAITILFPVALAWRWLTRSRTDNPQSDVRPLPGPLRWLNPLLAGLLAMEAAWLRWLPWRLPFGLSVMALARKPTTGADGPGGPE
jgi:ubiquinone/menaquinone biosynthesis C-methylase UbiE